nr:A24 family peptidase [Alysiella crassa]UOP08183.1 A24 family peptidase [Alysiella crassa]
MENAAIFMAVLFGLLVGSFLNVVIYRLPVILNREWNEAAREQLKLNDEFINTLPENAAQTLRQHISLTAEQQGEFTLSKPRSRCGNCGAPVKAWMNIPIISWLILRGKCHTCKTPISIRYPLVELLTGVLFGVVAWRYGWTEITVWGCLLTAFVVAMTFIDADTQLLPDQLTLPLIWLGLLFNWHTQFVSLESAVLGAVCGYMSLWTLNKIHKILRGMDGMGYGDFKMLAAIGAWCGAANLPIVVMMAALTGIVAALLKRVGKGQPMAFDPCLAIAGWLIFLFHAQAVSLITWWLQKSGF